ncbi:DUF4870 domain-containing protein [Zooshikella sp. WH53]|uniref:DUF4870 domain-containing protein n=1 Tax=Zooshikella harenae TaxID=2827238 RepID=A0ABS5ZHX1_9GAMM|nr:DUF4870 domain-containing protein [Zooshikella harenae]
MLFAFIISIVLCFSFIRFLLLPILSIFGLIVIIIAIVKSSKGEAYRYLYCIRFVK